jgi:PhnB protein
MSVNPYLYFPGTCAEAISFYEKHLGATVNMKLTFGETPMPPQPGTENLIAHVNFTILGSPLFASDAPGNMYQKPQGIRITLNPTGETQAHAFFNALADGGNADMPLQKTFWAKAFGMVTDQFGIPWMINCV